MLYSFQHIVYFYVAPIRSCTIYLPIICSAYNILYNTLCNTMYKIQNVEHHANTVHYYVAHITSRSRYWERFPYCMHNVCKIMYNILYNTMYKIRHTWFWTSCYTMYTILQHLQQAGTHTIMFSIQHTIQNTTCILLYLIQHNIHCLDAHIAWCTR